MVTTSRALLLGALLLGAIACHHKKDGVAHMDDVLGVFDGHGWKASQLPPTDAAKFSAQKCVAGLIDGIDAVLCEYGGPEAVTAGQKAAEAWVGNAVTGVALGNGRTVLGLADRRHSDPLGKAIHEVSRAYTTLE